MRGLYDVIRRASAESNSIIVGVSCGKDSLATLDLCAKHFEKVHGYFLYLVEGLGFQERYLAYLERRYGFQIHRLPHFGLSRMLRYASFRPHGVATNCELIDVSHIHAEVRRLTGAEWLATGEKMSDSIERRGMIGACQGVDAKKKKCYPLAAWSDKPVWSYLKMRGIPMPADYKMFGHSFGRMWAPEMRAIKDRYPDDYAKIIAKFPFAEAIVERSKLRESDAVEQVPAV